MRKRDSRPPIPFGVWIRMQSIIKNVELRNVARQLGVWPQNLTDKMRGVRHFHDSKILQIETMFGEKHSSKFH